MVCQSNLEYPHIPKKKAILKAVVLLIYALHTRLDNNHPMEKNSNETAVVANVLVDIFEHFFKNTMIFALSGHGFVHALAGVI